MKKPIVKYVGRCKSEEYLQMSEIGLKSRLGLKWLFLTAILHRGRRNWFVKASFPFSNFYLDFYFPFLFGIFNSSFNSF